MLQCESAAPVSGLKEAEHAIPHTGLQTVEIATEIVDTICPALDNKTIDG